MFILVLINCFIIFLFLILFLFRFMICCFIDCFIQFSCIHVFFSSVVSLLFLVFILFCSILFILVSKWFLRAAWYIYMLCMSQIFMSRCVGIFGPL